MRVVMCKCDMCGRNYELGNQYKHVDENGQEFPVNSIRLGDWDQKGKKWNSIASGYDLCSECARKICDAVFAGDSQIKMRAVVQKTRSQKDPKDKTIENVEESQQQFANEVTAENDGE